MHRNLLVILVFLITAPAFATTSKDFYCRKIPDMNPVYSELSVKTCKGQEVLQPHAICIYPSIGCLKIDENVTKAANLKYGKSFSALTLDQKEELIQGLTPQLWLQPGLSNEKTEKARKNKLLEGVTDDKKRADLLLLGTVELLPSTLECAAAKKSGECPGPENCKDDLYFNPTPAKVSLEDSILIPDGSTIPAKVFPTSKSANGG